MKWEYTQQWIANSKCLYGIALAYCSTGKNEVSKKDRETTSFLLGTLTPDDVAEELETYLSCNKSQDERIFNVWADKLKKGLIYLSSLKHLLYREGNYEEEWSVIWNEHRIIEKENTLEFLWYLVVSLDNRFQRLQSLAESITKSYGLANDTGFITALIRGNMPNSDEQESAKPICASISNTKKAFCNILQCEDKNAFMERLHSLIDGKSGKAVALVLYRAKKEGYIVKYPTHKEYESEFGLITDGKWESIRKHFDKGDSPDMEVDSSNIRFN